MKFFNQILPLPLDSEATIIELALYSQFKHHNESKQDILFIIYKDAENNKKVRCIADPKVEIFFTKPEYRYQWRTVRKYIEIDKVYPVIIEPRKIIPRIYKEMKEYNDPRTESLRKIYDQAVSIQDWRSRKEILKWQNTFMSDITVEEFYRIALGLQYHLTRAHEVDKAFLDIESDIYGLTTSQTNANEDPTNAVTVIFGYDPTKKKDDPKRKRPQVFTFLLRDHKRYPQQAYFEEHLDEFIQQCHKEFDKIEITKKGKKSYLETNGDYHINFFDNETNLQQAVFKVINMARPDTLAVWNIAYDLPKMKGRMERLGLNYVDVMCDPSFPKDARFVEINVDRRATVDMADRKTYVKMASTTKYIDQMQTYAAIRKGQKAYGSNKLDNIAEIELGIHKRTFDKGIDVTNAAIKDYWNFVLYNINDVWLQLLIDDVTNDMFTLIFDSNQHNCSLENLTKQTKYQKQIYYTEYIRRGFVPGNNKNNDYIRGFTEDYADTIKEAERARKYRKLIDEYGGDISDIEDLLDDLDEEDAPEDGEEDPETAELLERIDDVYADSIDRKLKLRGGLVGNPDLNSCNGAELIEGIPSKHVFHEVVDMDYASEYPWAKFTRSISESTQYGRLIIGEKISDRQNEREIKGYLPGAEFISDYVSQDYISLGNVWFSTPSVLETMSEIDEMINSSGGEDKSDG